MPPGASYPMLLAGPVSEPDSQWPVSIASEEKPLVCSQTYSCQLPETTSLALENT